MRKKILAVTFPSLLVLITLLISFLNYKSGTWLTGWDTIHPEFNFPLHFMRSLFGVWREDQGLGAVAAHAHMSELPRIFFLWIFSFFIPLSAVRYAFLFLCFILGPLGIYFFSRHFLLQRNKSQSVVVLAAFLAGLVYIFNLGTVQQFYVEFEMFVVQYAALGWLFLFATKILETKKNRDIFLFFIISFLSASMAYSSLLWFAYAGCIALYCFTYTLVHRKIVILRRSLIIGLVIFLSNAFWLLPNMYFLLTPNGQIPNQAHINKVFSPEAFYDNQAFGTFKDIPLLRNFLFNWLQYYPAGKFTQLLQVWQDHLGQPFVLVIGYGVFILLILGLILGILKKKREAMVLFPVWCITITMLINANPPFTFIFLWLREHSSLFEEGLRFPFTKFSLLYAFSFSIFFGLFFETVFTALKKMHKKTISFICIGLITTTVSMGLIWYGWPMFQGHLLDPKLRVNIPAEYFHFFDWSKKAPKEARFAFLPLETAYGWEYFKWGYEGPGFVWFGMQQPLLVRDFDRWSPYNETFYTQLSTAVYNNDARAFASTLQKFHVSYLLFDDSVLLPNQNRESLHSVEIKNMIAQIGGTEVFSDNFLHTYALPNQNGQFITAPMTYTTADGPTLYTKKDIIASSLGEYISTKSITKYFPFADVYKDEQNGVTYHPKSVTITRAIKDMSSEKELFIPHIPSESPFTVSTLFSYVGNKLVLHFDSSTVITVNQTNVELPHLEDVAVTTEHIFDKLIVEIANRQIEVPQNTATTSALLTLTPREPIKMGIFDENKSLLQDGKSFIDPNFIQVATTSASIWNDLLEDHSLPIYGSIKEITATTFQSPTPVLFNNPDAVINCDYEKRGVIEKKVTQDEVHYKAREMGAICDGAVLPITSLQSYLFHFVGKNVSGRSIKFNLQDITNNTSIIEELLPSKSFDKSYAMQTAPKLKANFYLSTETKASGTDSNENTISKIELYPIPLDRLAKIQITTKDALSQVKNSVVITHTWKFGTHEYGFHEHSDSENGIVTLSQSFEDGWVGFSLQNPFRFLDHVRYNGWANAWIVPYGDSDIVLFFWPQLLSFFGYLSLFFSFFFFLLHSILKIKQH